tara:strand:+ start:3175 stop:3558 length:384 start_codon:yes stop_codon:yes gene_type:complete
MDYVSVKQQEILLNHWRQHPLYLLQEDVKVRPEAYKLPEEWVLSALGMDPVKVLSPEDAQDMGVIAEGILFQELTPQGHGVWIDEEFYEELDFSNPFAYLRSVEVDEDWQDDGLDGYSIVDMDGEYV